MNREICYPALAESVNSKLHIELTFFKLAASAFCIFYNAVYFEMHTRNYIYLETRLFKTVHSLGA